MREPTAKEKAEGFTAFAPGRKTYTARRNMWGRVNCVVTSLGLQPHRLEPVGVHSPTGFELGYGGSGPSDLALTILLDHLGVPVEQARRALNPSQKKFRTADVRVLEAWMAHRRLVEQRLGLTNDFAEVHTEELERLLERKWLTPELEKVWDDGEKERIRKQREEVKKHSKPSTPTKEGGGEYE